MKEQKKKKILNTKIIKSQNLKKSKNQENAVTLIALIISIIVLLILAGVSLSALVRK